MGPIWVTHKGHEGSAIQFHVGPTWEKPYGEPYGNYMGPVWDKSIHVRLSEKNKNKTFTHFYTPPHNSGGVVGRPCVRPFVRPFFCFRLLT